MFRYKYKHKFFALICILLLLSVYPNMVFGNENLEDLKRQEQIVDKRIDELQGSVDEQQQIYQEVVDQATQLRNNIAQTQNQLSQNERRIQELTRTIDERNGAISQVRAGLAQNIRDLASLERNSTFALMLQYDSLSEAMNEIDQRKLLTEKIANQYNNIIAHTQSLQEAKEQMEMAKMALASLRISLDLQHQALRAEEERQAKELNSSKNLLAAAQLEKFEIRKQMFAAANDATGKAITFEEAIFYAQLASQRIKQHLHKDISVPLILAVVRQESNFGNYLGSGYYKDAMCSQAQIDAFIQITQSLGLDPELMPVSKPAKNQSCGGAMGYAQFLPTTWLGYAGEVAKLTGHNPPSPWNPEDAFTATAVKLTRDGATNGSTPAARRLAEWQAVMTYFSGSRWRNPAILPYIRWYGDNIMRTKDSYTSLLGI